MSAAIYTNGAVRIYGTVGGWIVRATDDAGERSLALFYTCAQDAIDFAEMVASCYAESDHEESEVA